MLASISSIRSCGKRIFFVADFALTDFVAITLPQISVGTPYIKKECKNSIDAWPHFELDLCGHTLICRCENSKARQWWNTNRASNHKVRWSNNMACIQHTQIRPKYTWRFLALNRHDKKAKPCRLSVDAATEREARSILSPHFILSLAARLPVLRGAYVEK
ncbi:host cell division inhibitor Icd-like protein [Klebsiella michiganensis]|uniref:host cell division inhibitor Icd-like protein n=1 Tax=Klebsiella michiganensis TaxID=1134687 RepID=UPI002899A85B|nr:host cell division inhibitor Icd-like protein [Klebsiella michiganensis]